MTTAVSANRTSRRSDESERFLSAQANVDRADQRHEPRTYGGADRNGRFQHSVQEQRIRRAIGPLSQEGAADPQSSHENARTAAAAAVVAPNTSRNSRIHAI